MQVLVISAMAVLGLAVSSEGVRTGPTGFSSRQQQAQASRGFINTNTTTNLTNTNADYFALTKDGRLEKIQLIFPEGVQVQMAVPVTNTSPFLLTPNGRLEKLVEPPKPTVVNYFKLTEDGRLEAIREQEIPADAEEESGEYHVLLPTGSLQRVRFMTSNRNNLFSAKVQYQEVEPITGPVYRYGSPLIKL